MAESVVTLVRDLTARVRKILLESVVSMSLMLVKQEFAKTVLNVLIMELDTHATVRKGKSIAYVHLYHYLNVCFV